MDHKKLSMEQTLAELKRLAAEMNCSVRGAAKEALLQKRSIQEYKVAQYNLARAMSRLRVHSDFENRR